VDLERARNQIAVRTLRSREKPFRRLEDAAQDLYVHGRVRTRAEVMERVRDTAAGDMRAAFERMLQSGAAAAITGKVPAGAKERWQSLLPPGRAIE
jgi:predicted Zn-dependent peptidase